MAIIIRGSSKCSICGLVLEKHDGIVAWPAFIGPGDPLSRYSDSGMHETCFEQWQHRDEMIYKYQVFRGEIQPEPEVHKTHVMILGSPDDRKALLDQLRLRSET